MTDKTRFRFSILLSISIAVLLIGTFGFMLTEKLSLVDSFYFTIVTVATVGYGDIAPITLFGKLLGVALIICGVGTFLGVVTTAIDMLEEKRERIIRIQKLHMVISVFFSEAGTKLLKLLIEFDRNRAELGKKLNVTVTWTEQDFMASEKSFRDTEHKIDFKYGRYNDLKTFLEGTCNLMLRLMENPTLLEDESFTELLRATVHLREELLHRDSLEGLPDSDYAHLSGDMARVYDLLVIHCYCTSGI